MKQSAVEQLGIAFREWQREWDSFEERGKDKPISYDEFIKPFLEIDNEKITDSNIEGQRLFDKHPHTQLTNDQA